MDPFLQELHRFDSDIVAQAWWPTEAHCQAFFVFETLLIQVTEECGSESRRSAAEVGDFDQITVCPVGKQARLPSAIGCLILL